MDKLARNKAAVRQIMEELARMTPSEEQSETQLIMDEERGHYVLFSVGWQDDLREYLPFVHLDVKPDGKVWIQHDRTDQKIALWLVDLGVPKNEVVLAFQPLERRKLIPDFALG